MKPIIRAVQPTTMVAALPRLLSMAKVSTQLDVSQKTVRRWIERGELPVHRLGRQLRISETDLAAFVAKSRRV
jgi:excisionase family DNA binding protein